MMIIYDERDDDGQVHTGCLLIMLSNDDHMVIIGWFCDDHMVVI